MDVAAPVAFTMGTIDRQGRRTCRVESLSVILIGKTGEAILWLTVAVVALRAVLRFSLTVELGIPQANLYLVSLSPASVKTDPDSVINAE